MIRSSIVVVTWFSLHAIVSAEARQGSSRIARATRRHSAGLWQYPAWSTMSTASAG